MGCTEGFVVHDHDMVVNSGHDGGHAEAGAEIQIQAKYGFRGVVKGRDVE